MLVVLVVVLIAGHGVLAYYVSSHVAVAALLLSGAAILLGLPHLTLLSALSALFRRRSRGRQP